MATWRVNADFTVNVLAVVEADSEDEARRIAVGEILSKNCEFQDPIDEPTINWVEAEDDEFEQDDDICPMCGEGCGC